MDRRVGRSFFALAVRAMRQVLVDHARRKLAEKRGESPQEPLGEKFHRLPNYSPN